MDKQDKIYRLEIVKTTISTLLIIISLIIATNQITNSSEIHASQLSTELLFDTLELEREIHSIRIDTLFKLEEYNEESVPEGILTKVFSQKIT